MFLDPMRLKTQGAALTLGALAMFGCSDNTARTDLRPEGPPDVLAVLVLNDSVAGLVETATYCKHGDEKRPTLVGLPDFTTTQLCPDDLNADPTMATDASPDTFYVRVMFDELLQPDVEDLIPILDDNGLETGSFTGTLAQTQPVTLKCTGVDGMLHDVNYDGYYSPSGNSVTWPVGPSLVIKPVGDVVVPTNSACEVAIKDTIKDKQGNVVPMDQRGPFKFKISGIKPLVVDPADGSSVDVSALYGDNWYLQSNTSFSEQEFCIPDDGSCDATAAFQIPAVFAASDDLNFSIKPEPGFCAASGAACVTQAHCAANTCADNGMGGLDCTEEGDPTDPTDDCTTTADCTENTCDPGGLYAYSLRTSGFSAAEFGIGPGGYPETESEYTLEVFKSGAKIADRCASITTFGAPDVKAQTKVTVKTNPFGLAKTGAFNLVENDTIPGVRKPKVTFTAPIVLSAIDRALVDLTPAPLTTRGILSATEVGTTATYTTGSVIAGVPTPAAHNLSVGDMTYIIGVGVAGYNGLFTVASVPTTSTFTVTLPTSGLAAATAGGSATAKETVNQMIRTTGGLENDMSLQGHFQPSTSYTLTLKDGLTFKDNYGKEYKQAGDKVIHFKTQAVALTSTTVSGSTITKATPTSATPISFTFNFGMDVTTFNVDDVELTGTPTTLTFAAAPSTCGISNTSCTLRATGTFVAGDYQLKLKAGAIIKDRLGNDYVQAADRIVKFTIKEAAPAPTIPCLGAN